MISEKKVILFGHSSNSTHILGFCNLAIIRIYSLQKYIILNVIYVKLKTINARISILLVIESASKIVCMMAAPVVSVTSFSLPFSLRFDEIWRWQRSCTLQLKRSPAAGTTLPELFTKTWSVCFVSRAIANSTKVPNTKTNEMRRYQSKPFNPPFVGLSDYK